MRRTIVAAIGIVVLAGNCSLAHHSYAGFFLDRTVSVEGDVEEFLYANPQVMLKVRAQDASIYTAIWLAALNP